MRGDLAWVHSLEAPVQATGWFGELAPPKRAWLARERTGHALRQAIEFEAGLLHGLLALCRTIPEADDRSLWLRQEIAEEAHHSLLFAKLLATMSTEDWRGTPLGDQPGSEWAQESISRAAVNRPEIFWLLVLAGEEPIDAMQRAMLRRSRDLLPQPLTDVLDVHVREEASHIRFARAQLRAELSTLPAARERVLKAAAPSLAQALGQRILAIPAPLLTAAGCKDANTESQRLFQETFPAASRQLRAFLRQVGVNIAAQPTTSGPVSSTPARNS